MQIIIVNQLTSYKTICSAQIITFHTISSDNPEDEKDDEDEEEDEEEEASRMLACLCNSI